MNKVSVIIPARNRTKLLARAIESVKCQEVDCEIIVIDDGSQPPLSVELPEKILRSIKLLTNDSNRNAAYSRNRGVSAASCEFVAFLDSDDEWLPDHLKLALGNLEHDKSMIHITPVSSNTCPGFISDPCAYLFENNGDFRTSGLVCTKKTFNRVGGFDEQLEKHQDWDLVLRAAKFFRLSVGAAPTIRLNLTDEERMSAAPNLKASERFIEKHRQNMNCAQISSFFSRVVRSAVAQGDRELLETCRALALKHTSLSELDAVTRLCCYHPTFGRLILNGRQWFRKVF